MKAIQLELDLWSNLSAAAASPLAANMNQLWQDLEVAIAPLPQQLQLAIVPEAILRIAQIHAERAQSLLDDWEATDECDDEPILNEDILAPMLRQTMTLDLEALLEPPPLYPRSSHSNSQSVASVVDKAAMLDVLDDIATERPDEEDPGLVAHVEDISAWTSAIAEYFSSRQVQSLPLLELVQKVRYPTQKQQDCGSQLVKTWLALLLGGFRLEQQEFYDLESIEVWC
ncbi:hypothetical protein H6G17_20275 [Chroococcidiopsis sp. FACHB-1243]|uniref:hypothetical protein n=1 Tax=Chroococcidiopsis sp. [FACHB-1243] TaxID=2692781 RepID=UPI00177E59B1|nr:hypothetical protein [Chroococcidiopsis sp. [FACHB-1243]]MBD2307809.1 hypothetical protein [Chroococcidiopsis sp. [FACHB-1243]]